MSLDLYERDINERMSGFRPISAPEPGVFDNFLYSAGTAAMRTFASAARAGSMAAGGVVSAVERMGAMHPLSDGTVDRRLSDAVWKFHDETMQRAVDYWTPNPTEVGAAGQVVGQLLATLPLVIASPSALVAATQLGTAEDLLRKGVDSDKAQAVGAVQAAGLGLGIWMPILGQNLWQRVALGGAGFNAAQGVATRAASGAILEGTSAADEFKAFDPQALTLDVLLGAAFGAIAHLSPAQRAQGKEFLDKLKAWGQDLKQSDVDALSVLRQAQHMNVDSMPGRPVDVQDIEAHVQRVKAAIDQLAGDKQVQLDDMPAPRVAPDAARMAEAERNAKQLTDIAEQVRQAEGLPQETEARPAPSPAEPPRSMTDEQGGAEVRNGGEHATDPLSYAAERVLSERPDLTFSMGKDADGNPVTMSARQYLDQVRADVQQASDDARLFEVAAVCLLGKV